MSQQIINNGGFVNDPSAETIYASFSKAKSNFAELYGASVTGPPWHNVLDYGAVGNYIGEGTDTGADDTTAIQAAITAATSSYGVVVFPAGHNYKITSTLTCQLGVQLIGIGGRRLSGSGGPATITWRGTAGGTMINVTNGASNTPNFRFENLELVGGRAHLVTSEWAGKGIYFSGGGVDTGTVLEFAWIGAINGDAVVFDNGSTNSSIRGGRFDQISGYAIRHNMGGNVIQQIHDITYDNWDAAKGSPWSSGFLYLDATGTTANTSKVSITGFHPEVNGFLIDTYAAGANPSDRRGLIRLGINPAAGNVQHTLLIDDLTVSAASGTKSFSVIQCTSTAGTLQQHIDHVSIVMHQANATREPVDATQDLGNAKLLGNVPTSYEHQFPWRGRIAQFIRCGNPAIDTERPMVDIHTGELPRFGALTLRPLTLSQLNTLSPAPTEGSLAAVTDSNTNVWGATIAGGGTNNVLAFYNNSVWTVAGK